MSESFYDTVLKEVEKIPGIKSVAAYPPGEYYKQLIGYHRTGEIVLEFDRRTRSKFFGLVKTEEPSVTFSDMRQYLEPVLGKPWGESEFGLEYRGRVGKDQMGSDLYENVIIVEKSFRVQILV